VLIDEPSHPRVRAARRCHRPSGRTRTGRFLAEGPQAVREALGIPGVVHEVFATPAWLESSTGFDLQGVTVHRVTGPVLDLVAETTSPQGVVAVCRDVTVGLDVVLDAPLRLVVVLAEVRDPGNAGTIIRTADAAGADAVVLTASSVDPLGGKCVRSSAGSIFHLPVVVQAPPTVLHDLAAAGLTVLAADGAGDIDLVEAGERGLLSGPTAWVVGNEAHGVPPEYSAACSAAVRVPMYGQAESLNVSVASAICLYASAMAHAGRPTGATASPSAARPPLD
jgi:TrmH family RNA methyltransferase